MNERMAIGLKLVATGQYLIQLQVREMVLRRKIDRLMVKHGTLKDYEKLTNADEVIMLTRKLAELQLKQDSLNPTCKDD